MAAVTIDFSIPEEEQARLDHLVEHFAQGNREEFLRLAMLRMEAVERAERLRDLQTYGVQQRAASGLSDTTADAIIHRVLSSGRP